MQDDDCQLLVPTADVGPNYLGGIGLTTVHKLVGDGALVQVHIGRRSFITRRSIEAYVDLLAGAQ